MDDLLQSLNTFWWDMKYKCRNLGGDLWDWITLWGMGAFLLILAGLAFVAGIVAIVVTPIFIIAAYIICIAAPVIIIMYAAKIIFLGG